MTYVHRFSKEYQEWHIFLKDCDEPAADDPDYEAPDYEEPEAEEPK